MRMVYRPGAMAVFDGVSCDYKVIEEGTTDAALADGWFLHFLDMEARPRRGRPPKAKDQDDGL